MDFAPDPNNHHIKGNGGTCALRNTCCRGSNSDSPGKSTNAWQHMQFQILLRLVRLQQEHPSAKPNKHDTQAMPAAVPGSNTLHRSTKKPTAGHQCCQSCTCCAAACKLWLLSCTLHHATATVPPKTLAALLGLASRLCCMKEVPCGCENPQTQRRASALASPYAAAPSCNSDCSPTPCSTILQLTTATLQAQRARCSRCCSAQHGDRSRSSAAASAADTAQPGFAADPTRAAAAAAGPAAALRAGLRAASHAASAAAEEAAWQLPCAVRRTTPKVPRQNPSKPPHSSPAALASATSASITAQLQRSAARSSGCRCGSMAASMLICGASRSVQDASGHADFRPTARPALKPVTPLCVPAARPPNITQQRQALRARSGLWYSRSSNCRARASSGNLCCSGKLRNGCL